MRAAAPCVCRHRASTSSALEFSSQGLPSSGRIGFEIFDRTAFGATEFLEQVNYRRALEGEIARTIGTLSEVSSARVHIAMARQSLFASREQPAKASVVLKLRATRPLAESTVQGITNLVASSVEGLRAESVVIMDSFGRPLSRPQASEDAAPGGVQLERQQQIQRELAASVTALLEPVVGASGVRVNVSARMDAASEEATEERWDPAASAVRSRQINSDGARLAPSEAQGVAGARSNMPPPVARSGRAPRAPPPAAAPPSTSTGRGSETVNYEISRTTKHTIRPRGDLARLSVAVILDNETVTTKTADGSVVHSSKPRSPEQLQKISALVSAAVGLDTERGDQLTVENVPFEEAPVETPAAATLWQRYSPQAFDSLRILTPLALGLLAMFVVVRPLVRRALLPTVTESARGHRPASAHGCGRRRRYRSAARRGGRVEIGGAPAAPRADAPVERADDERAGACRAAHPHVDRRGREVGHGSRERQPSQLSGVRKAAVFTLLLGEDPSAAVFKHLHEDEIEQIAREVAILGAVPAPTGEQVLDEFHNMWQAAEFVARGGVDYAQKLLVKSLGADMARRLLDKLVKSFESTVVLHRDREGRPAAAVEVHPGRAPADHRAHPGAPEAVAGGAARGPAARMTFAWKC